MGSWRRDGYATTAGYRLARAAASLRDLRMRGAVIAEQLRVLAVGDAVAALDDIIEGALCKRADAARAYDALVDARWTAAALGRDLLEALADEARRRAAPYAALWLQAALDETPAPDTADLVHADLREVTLGERRSSARRAQGELLRKLLADPDPTVIRNVLANSRITEAAVLAICARRPTTSAALEAVLGSPRWGTRYRVRCALAHNPHLRESAARALLICLRSRDLAEIRDDGTLPDARRETASRLLARLG